MIVVILKRCIRCRESKPTAEFHCDSRSRDGLQAYCKTCKIRQVEGRRAGLRAARAWRGITEKRCPACGEVKPAARFYLSPGELDGLSYDCRACRRRSGKNRRRRIAASGPVPCSHKRCRKCGEVRVRDAFAKDASSVDGLSPNCRACNAIMQASAQYAIPFEEAARLRGQSTCDICQANLTPRTRNIDHCHVTGRVRGVLCRNCNFMLGMSKDRPAVLERGAEYLRANGAMEIHAPEPVTTSPLAVH